MATTQLPNTSAEVQGKDPLSHPVSSTLRKLMAPLVILLIAAALAVAMKYRHATSQTNAVVEPLPVAVIKATEVPTYTVTRWFTGRIVPRRSSDVGFELNGRVARVLVDDGEQVQAGQVRIEADRSHDQRAA